MALGRIKPWMTGRLATPMDATAASTGRLASAHGSWSAADDLLTTVDAYAPLLGRRDPQCHLPGSWIAERTRILSSLEDDPIWNCAAGPGVTCATHYGHGLRWMVYHPDRRKVAGSRSAAHVTGDLVGSIAQHCAPHALDGHVGGVRVGQG
jgi:hypothetical protein